MAEGVRADRGEAGGRKRNVLKAFAIPERVIRHALDPGLNLDSLDFAAECVPLHLRGGRAVVEIAAAGEGNLAGGGQQEFRVRITAGMQRLNVVVRIMPGIQELIALDILVLGSGAGIINILIIPIHIAAEDRTHLRDGFRDMELIAVAYAPQRKDLGTERFDAGRDPKLADRSFPGEIRRDLRHACRDGDIVDPAAEKRVFIKLIYRRRKIDVFERAVLIKREASDFLKAAVRQHGGQLRHLRKRGLADPFDRAVDVDGCDFTVQRRIRLPGQRIGDRNVSDLFGVRYAYNRTIPVRQHAGAGAGRFNAQSGAVDLPSNAVRQGARGVRRRGRRPDRAAEDAEKQRQRQQRHNELHTSSFHLKNLLQ